MTKTVAETVVEVLDHYGVDVIFGIPGVHILEICAGGRGPTGSLPYAP